MANASGLEALGDPTRRSIFEHLAEHPSAVGDLAALLPVSRPAVSQHLRVLRDAGLVTADREGNRRVYRVDPEGLAEVRDYIDRFWSTALSSYKRALDGAKPKERNP